MSKTSKPEQTSAKVATIAGRILRKLADQKPSTRIYAFVCLGTVSELRALAGSALTQTADRKRK